MTGYFSSKLFVAGVAIVLLASCVSREPAGPVAAASAPANPVSYFEIPVEDLDRAIEFYEAVFSLRLQRTVIDGLEMALFPFSAIGQGASGALVKGKSYVPSRSGPRLYFFVASIDDTLRRALANGGSVAYPKTLVGDFWVAEFDDSEGNQIALSAATKQAQLEN